MKYVENKTFDELEIGDRAQATRVLTEQDLNTLFVISDWRHRSGLEQGSLKDASHQLISGEFWGGALIASLITSELPGQGSGILGQMLNFGEPVTVGEVVTIKVTVRSKDAEKKQANLECLCTNSGGDILVSGETAVSVPTEKIRSPQGPAAGNNRFAYGAQHNRLIAATEALDPILTAVVHPCDEASLEGALQAMSAGLITPILVGPQYRIRETARKIDAELETITIVDAEHSHAAAEKAVKLAREGKAEALMKGALHTDEVMSATVDSANGLRTERRMSHVFVMDVPSYPKPLLITDAAINIAPDLRTKADIAQNAIELAQALGVLVPKVAILAAVETVFPTMPSTVEAAALCKMADRGQITGGLLDGPLAFDNAISKKAAQTKGIVSQVAGEADILLAPDLEAGNMIAKQLIYLAGAASAGLVVGARVPIMLTSRADGIASRVASASLAQLLIRHREKQLKA